MSLSKVVGFQKILSIDERANHFASVFLDLADERGQRTTVRYDFTQAKGNTIEFLFLVHMLENDIVFYDTQSRVFSSQKEQVTPNPRAFEHTRV